MTRNVLYLMANAVPGGAERATMMMVASHDRRRYVPAICFFSEGPLVESAKHLDVDVHVLPKPMRLRHPASVAQAIGEVRRRAKGNHTSLIHSCMSYAHLVGGPAATAAEVPAVFYQHGPVGSWMDRAATLVRCDRVLANSEFTAEEQRANSWRRRSISIAPLAVDIRISDDQRRTWRAAVEAEHGLQADAPVIAMIARFDPWKGIDVALRAAAPLLRARPKLRFLIVGGQYRHFHQEYDGELRALVAREQIERQVIFAGYRLDVRPYLARMTVLVHASRQPEPFGLTVLEAMACGVPVIAVRGGGVSEIVTQGHDGLLYPSGDEAALRNAVAHVLDDASLRQSLADAALETVELRYRPHHMMQRIEGIYDQVLAS